MGRRTTEGQVFYLDALVAFMIFLFAVIAFFAFSGNATSTENRVFDALVGDSESISESLVSQGFPPGWNPSNVGVIGLTDGTHRLNFTKVSAFFNMSANATTRLFGTGSNYMVFFKDMSGNVLPFNGCTFNNVGISVQNITPYLCQNITSPDSTQLVSNERLVFYNSQIIKMVVYVWV